ncbi:hypothetical protein OPIT5_01625 [Opitutaceae bacterium TAV5]|nr:hypothetical protein OPIT5_01625 [Opitutaceae bacterium TAV5]
MIIINILFALLTYWFAQRKHREAVYWAVAGGITPLFTILGLAFFCDLAVTESEEARARSLKREKIFLLIMLAVGLLNIVGMYIYRE